MTGSGVYYRLNDDAGQVRTKETDFDRKQRLPAAAPPEAISQPAYEIDRSSPDEIVVHIRRGRLSEEKISRFLAVLDLETIREKSQLTEEAAQELADEIDRAVWEKVRHHVSAAQSRAATG